MKKRIISLITAAAMVLPVTAVDAGAVFVGYLTDKELNDTELMEKHFGVTERADSRGCKEKLVSTFVSGRSWQMVEIYDVGTCFTVRFPADADKAAISEFIAERCPGMEFDIFNTVEKFTEMDVTDPENTSGTAALVRELCKELDEKFVVEEFSYIGHVYKPVHAAAPGKANKDGLFDYNVTYMGEDIENIKNEVAAFLEEAGIQAELVEDVRAMNGDYTIKPAVSMTLDEKFAIARELYEKFGLTYKTVPLESPEPTFELDMVDVLRSVDGDANCDSKLSIADATAIMQSIGNPDKYGLSMQGKFNADIYNIGDGITGMDAVTVMEKCIKHE